MRRFNKLTYILLTVIVLLLATSCRPVEDEQTHEQPPFTTYRDIPGLTEQDLQAIETLLAKRESFSYGMMLSTEAFIDSNNEINGFSKQFCLYLTELFGVAFVPEITSFEQLFEGLVDGSIDFTGTLTPTPERSQTYYMTDPIAQRAVKCFRLAGSEPLADIMATRAPKYALLNRSASTQAIIDFSFYEFEPVYIDEYIDAYELLASGEIDALLAESSAESTFDFAGDVVSEDFYPMINSFVSLTAYSSELEPIINAVQKMLEGGGAHYIGDLYDAGYNEYLRHKLSLQLTPEERQFIDKTQAIPFAAEFDNYPICFFDERSGKWQGIAIDVMDEICQLTGLEYFVANEKDATFHELYGMLESGEVYMISELIFSPEREGQFLWPDKPFITDSSVLMSRTGYHHISVNRIYLEKVGLVDNTAHTEFFLTWFPNHPQTTVFYDYYSAMEALRKGEVDLVMTSYSTTLYLSNYLEETLYKPSVIFDNSFESTFGINNRHQLLLSIVNKAMALANIAATTDNWTHKTYDYRLNLAEQNNTLFRNMILIMLCGLLLVIALLIRNHYMSKSLEELVDVRTQELESSVGELSKARDEAEIANRSKSYFLANMSHEIRTPMNAIAGITEIILLNEDIPPDVKDGLSRIHSSCDMLMGIINDILDFSKIEAGKLDIIEKEYFVASIINDSAQLNMMRIGEKNIKFLLDIDENTPVKLLGDELRIKQIMNNLLSNAFKYTEKGEVKLAVTAEEHSDPMRGAVLIITVTDTGCGMSREQLDKLFEDYTRFNHEVSISVEGTGLGLAITRRLVTLMNGNIEVESKVGEGSAFTVRLPQGKVDDEVLGKEITDNLKDFRLDMGRSGKGHSIVRDPMPYGRVLSVDDVETNLYVSIGLMKPYMLKIDTALSGQEAIALVKAGNTYDIIFMDHMMPEMDGVEAAKRLRELGYDAPIVALTANAVAGQADMFLQNGFDDFIAKPIDTRQLNDVLNRLIRDKQPQEVIDKARRESADNKVQNAEPRKGSDVSPAGAQRDVSAPSDDSQFSIINSELAVPGLDIEKGLEKYDFDEGIYVKILSSYAANSRAILDAISDFGEVGEDNVADYRLRVHSMKGTSLDIYADHIGNTAAQLEQAAKAGEFDYIMEHTPAFLKAAYQIVDDLDALLCKIIDSNPRPVKDKPDEKALKQLKEACEMYSMDGVNKAMDEIEKYAYESDDGLAQWLREKVNVMGFAQIVERLGDI